MALIRVRRGTTAEWTNANPILAAGEPGYDTTTETFKVGNGVDQWDSLDEIKGTVVSVNGQEGVVVLDASDVGARGDDWVPTWSDVEDKPTTFAPSAHTHDDRYYTETETNNLLDDKVDADALVSDDAGNAATLGTDGGVYVDAAQPPGDYVEASDIASQFKYAAPVWVLEANEDEDDLPEDFPTAPFFDGGPPPIVLRKKEE